MILTVIFHWGLTPLFTATPFLGLIAMIMISIIIDNPELTGINKMIWNEMSFGVNIFKF